MLEICMYNIYSDSSKLFEMLLEIFTYLKLELFIL